MSRQRHLEQNNRECHLPPSLTITFEQLRGVKRALAHVVGVTQSTCCRFRHPSPNKGESINFKMSPPIVYALF